jgi:hypothetical protein
MSSHPRSRTRRYGWLPLCLAVPLVVASACSSNGSNAATPAATSAAPSATAGTDACAAVTANAAAKPPADIPTPADATFYETSKVGATTLYFAYAPGADVRQRRDAIKTALEQAGYEIKGTDAEDNEEAELEFEGKGHGESSVQVIHREGCESQLRIRFRIGA